MRADAWSRKSQGWMGLSIGLFQFPAHCTSLASNPVVGMRPTGCKMQWKKSGEETLVTGPKPITLWLKRLKIWAVYPSEAIWQTNKHFQENKKRPAAKLQTERILSYLTHSIEWEHCAAYCCVTLHIVLVWLEKQAYTCSLKWLSVVQIINANSATADLAFLLLAALRAQNIQERPLRDCVSANFLSSAFRA